MCQKLILFHVLSWLPSVRNQCRAGHTCVNKPCIEDYNTTPSHHLSVFWISDVTLLLTQMYIYTLHHLCTQITQGAGKSYIKHLTSENLDTWVERRGIRPLLATNIDMYRAGHMPVSTTESPPSTQQLLQPHPQSHGTRASPSVKLQDAAILCQPSSSYFNSNTSPSVMSRIKELGMQEDMKRKWPPAGSEGLDHSPLWLRREQDPQMVPKLSPALPVVSAKINPNSMSAQSKQYSMSRLFQEISQAEIPGKQWSNVINQVSLFLPARF